MKKFYQRVSKTAVRSAVETTRTPYGSTRSRSASKKRHRLRMYSVKVVGGGLAASITLARPSAVDPYLASRWRKADRILYTATSQYSVSQCQWTRPTPRLVTRRCVKIAADMAGRLREGWKKLEQRRARGEREDCVVQEAYFVLMVTSKMEKEAGR